LEERFNLCDLPGQLPAETYVPMTTATAAILLFLVMDPMGNVPLFVSFLAGVEPRRARMIVVRELLVALTVLPI
jgi:small neutral amino acid transporter SnatA (MarC family)